jgi:hypothetical protein
MAIGLDIFLGKGSGMDNGLDIYGLGTNLENAVKSAVFAFRAFHNLGDGDANVKAYGPPTEHKFHAWVTIRPGAKPVERLISDSPGDAKSELSVWLDELALS